MTWIDGLAILIFALCGMGVWIWSMVTQPSLLREWLVWGALTSAAMAAALYRIEMGLFKALGGGLFIGYLITGMGLLRYHSFSWNTGRENSRPYRSAPLDTSRADD
ncbi:MAG: hypothetical protein J7521_13705 [Caulobacter sp.]|nr:hypothetical protein [Caulobacter sp.]